jgi:3-dehydroquinate synthetase
VIGDPLLFQICRQGWQAVQSRLEEVICRCMGVKVRVIQEDPYEKGVRAALNLGHTVGHALELLSGFALRHGEAVAIGMVAESRMAERLGLAVSGLAREIEAALAGLGLPTQIPASISPAQIVLAMRVDKKRAAGKVRFALPVEIGEVRVTVEIEDIEGLLEP